MQLTAAPDDLSRAHATLDRGARFVELRLAAGGQAGRCADTRFRARTIGNGLRELDRFLQLLVEAIAVRCGIGLPERTHTADKIARLRRHLAVDDPDRAQLLALGRTRACLFHCEGLVRRGDAHGSPTLTIGWRADGGTGLARVAVGERLDPSAAELREIGRYYRTLAGRLLSEAGLTG